VAVRVDRWSKTYVDAVATGKSGFELLDPDEWT